MMLFYLLIALQVKHFVFDFVLQNRYQLDNKGTYGHPGGILHAGLHGLGTGIIVFYFTDTVTAAFLGALDMLIHYHIDWAKVKLNSKMRLTPADQNFWVLLGLDQYFHQLTYIVILFILAVS
jgi:hypothetical protein